MTKDKAIRSIVKRKAMSHWETDWHAESRTHIVWAPWIKPYSPKGFGFLADEAYADYGKSVQKVVDEATIGDLEFWLELYEAQRKKS